MNNYPIRCLRLIFGLFLFALGICFTIQANIGLSPWEALTMGLSHHIPLSYGVLTIASGVAILVLDCAMGEKLGVGTVINTILIGVFVDMIYAFNAIPLLETLVPGVAMLLAGQFSICVGSYYYIGAGLGCGPRDALMVAVGKRLPRIPIGAIRGAIEGAALFVGWLLGAKVGVGTVIAVFGIGFILQWTFALFRFNVRAVVHESIADTIGRLRAGGA